jgi:hypothetical protein
VIYHHPNSEPAIVTSVNETHGRVATSALGLRRSSTCRASTIVVWHEQQCDVCDMRREKTQLVIEGIASTISDRKPTQFHVLCFQLRDHERREALKINLPERDQTAGSAFEPRAKPRPAR